MSLQKNKGSEDNDLGSLCNSITGADYYELDNVKKLLILNLSDLYIIFINSLNFKNNEITFWLFACTVEAYYLNGTSIDNSDLAYDYFLTELSELLETRFPYNRDCSQYEEFKNKVLILAEYEISKKIISYLEKISLTNELVFPLRWEAYLDKFDRNDVMLTLGVL